MIKLDDICFAYDTTPVLSHFNLSIDNGEFVVIKGDNGCGKSTLLNIINGLSFAERGSYTFDGQIIDEGYLKKQINSKSFHQRVGYVFQNTDVQLFCARVTDEIAFGPTQMGLPQTEIDKRVEDIISLVGIDSLRDRAPYQLSMGEKKKVALASILSTNPDVLVLDEPMNFLDKKSREWIKAFLSSLKGIKTIVIVSHTDDFDSIADMIVSM